jgi:NTP pyrophosphatase (non-canonical NTP hydrolase)
MVDLKKLQKRVYKNKVKQGFNVTNIEKEFCYIQTELGEAIKAYNKKLPDLGEELADITIYLLGLSEILGINLEKEIVNKIKKNEKREYKIVNGVLTRVKEG